MATTADFRNGLCIVFKDDLYTIVQSEYMATTADFRNGLCIVFKDDLYTIVQFQHVKPGKGPAFVRTKLRNVKTGRILENTFTSGVKIDTARIERRPYQFLYKEGEDYVMMHTETM